MSKFAQVAVEHTAFSFDRLFTYEIPQEFQEKVQPGMRVSVPFGTGNKTRVGMIFSLAGEEGPGIKTIISVLDQEPVLEQELLSLASWMRERYYCTYFDAIKTMLPAGAQVKLQYQYFLADGFKDFDRDRFSDIQWRVILFLRSSGKSLPVEKIEKEVGIDENHPDFLALLEENIVVKIHKASGKVGDAVTIMLRAIPDFSGKLTPRQQSVYETLCDVGGVSEKELCYFTGASSSVIKALVDKNACQRFTYEKYRRPETSFNHCEQGEIELSSEQQCAFQDLLFQMENGKECALLFGVTGSGKTSVFLKLIQHVLSQGKGVIAMVPEISLTAQTISLFQSLFGDTVAVFHSRLSLGERLDEWKRVKRGKAKVVVGTRSAVFAPVKNLGLIVLDEEQEHTYQSESSPRYHAREVALFRCKQSKGFCLLASATPSVEVFYQAQEGRIGFASLPKRYGDAKIPDVQLIDRNQDSLGQSEIGPVLSQALQENYQNGKQSIVLLNRRGYHTFATCRSCQQVIMCPHCSISLTYHAANRRFMCHYCGYSQEATSICPSCGNSTVTFQGTGTQRAEEQLQKLLPDARILRLDTDAISEKYSLEKKLSEFARGEYDVMVGTQMVAKGLDFENVTLVGVVSADQYLFNDDYRSNERTFDLLTQVVGRAGRGKYVGRALIQTYYPENAVLQYAAKQDYLGFYEMEKNYRQALLYPPFVDLLMVGFVGEDEVLVSKGANTFLQMLCNMASDEYGSLPMRVLRPSAAAVAKVGGKYRYKLLVKSRNTPLFREMVARLLRSFSSMREYKSITAYADRNPYSIL